MTKFEQHLLTCVYRDLVALRQVVNYRDDLVRGERGAMVRDQKLARENRLVPLELRRWFGHAPTPADRKRFQRAADKLQAAGLLRRVALGDWNDRYTTHIHLTADGEVAAAKLNKEGQECQLTKN